MVYTYGGLAFLIPYFIFLIVLGIPIFFIEVVIGQYSALTPITVFGEMAPLFRGIYLKTNIFKLFLNAAFKLIYRSWIRRHIFKLFTRLLL